MRPPGPLEIGLILVIILIVFGVGKLPQVGAAFGKGIRAFKKGQTDEEEEMEKKAKKAGEEEEEEEEEEEVKPKRKTRKKKRKVTKKATAKKAETEAGEESD